MKRLYFLLSACILSSLPSVSLALHHPSHWSVDLRRNLNAAPDPTQDHYVETGCLIYSGPGQCGKFGIYDKVLVKGLTPFTDWNLGGLIWVNNNNPTTLMVTTMYGVDASPGSANDFMQWTGFNAATPEVSFSLETYIGTTQEYVADSLGTFAIGDLATAFPDLDFPQLVGDPSSIVYAFTAVVPASDFPAIPEPSALFLVGTAVAGLAFRLRFRG